MKPAKLLFVIKVASAALFVACAPVAAQWQVPSGEVALGKGAGTGFTSTKRDNIFSGQFVGLSVNLYGARNDGGTTNNARYIYDAAVYANANRLGLIFHSGSSYFTTPIQFGGSNISTGTFTGSISGTTLTVTTTPTIPLAIGQSITCGGCTADTVITAYGTKASGFIGTYTVNNSQSVGSTTITATAPSFTASISGTTMTVSAVANGRVTRVDSLVGVASIIPGTTVVSQSSGTTGLAGTYTVSYSQTVASTTVRAYPYTVVPIPQFVSGAPGGETATAIAAYGSVAVPQAVFKYAVPAGLGAVLGFETANLRITGMSLYGNAAMFHGFGATSSGGQPVARNLTLSGATGSTCGLNIVGNGMGGVPWGVIEARFDDITLVGNTVCDVNMDGNNGDGSHNVQSIFMSNVKANSASTGNGFNLNYANPTCIECLSQNHTGVPIAFDNTYHSVFINFYSEADAGGAVTSTANTSGVKMTGTLVSGVDSGLSTCSNCNIDIHIGSGLGTFPTNTQRNAGVAYAQTLNVAGTAGVGYIELPVQSSAPSTPSSALRLFTDASIRLAWKNTSGFVASFQSAALTANRAYVLPDAAGTIALTAGAAIPTVATGDILYGSAANTLSALADVATGNALISGGVSTAPSWGKIGISTHVSGLGTSVATALGVNVGTAGAFVVNGGALGTPSSGTVTNLTGTASININGTVGATTPTTGAFTNVTVTSSSTPANGIYLPAANTFAIATNSAQSVTVTGSSMGVGITSPSTYVYGTSVLAVGSTSAPSAGAIGTVGAQTGDGAVGNIEFNNDSIGGADRRLALVRANRSGANNSGQLQFFTWNAGSGASRLNISPAGVVSTTANIAATSSTVGEIVTTGGAAIGGALWSGTYVATGVVAVASLPACGSGIKGARMFVNNATATTFASTVAGGGANNVPVVCDGTNWIIGANDNVPIFDRRKFA